MLETGLHSELPQTFQMKFVMLDSLVALGDRGRNHWYVLDLLLFLLSALAN
jgi:hypothetical protein